MIAKNQSIGINGRGWTRNGIIVGKSEEKIEPAITSEAEMSLDEKILQDLKSGPFIKGQTLPELMKKYGVTRQKIYKIRKANNLK